MRPEMKPLVDRGITFNLFDLLEWNEAPWPPNYVRNKDYFFIVMRFDNDEHLGIETSGAWGCEWVSYGSISQGAQAIGGVIKRLMTAQMPVCHRMPDIRARLLGTNVVTAGSIFSQGWMEEWIKPVPARGEYAWEFDKQILDQTATPEEIGNRILAYRRKKLERLREREADLPGLLAYLEECYEEISTAPYEMSGARTSFVVGRELLLSRNPAVIKAYSRCHHAARERRREHTPPDPTGKT